MNHFLLVWSECEPTRVDIAISKYPETVSTSALSFVPCSLRKELSRFSLLEYQVYSLKRKIYSSIGVIITGDFDNHPLFCCLLLDYYLFTTCICDRKDIDMYENLNK